VQPNPLPEGAGYRKPELKWRTNRNIFLDLIDSRGFTPWYFMQIKILLIEDQRANAIRFIDKIQEELGRDVEVEWRVTLMDALKFLKSGNEVDQIWLDTCLSDVEDRAIPGALEALKRYVEPGELRVLTQDVTEAEFRKKTRVPSQVDVFDKSELSKMTDAVQQLLAKRSSPGNATTRVEMARLEGQIINLQHSQSEDRDRFNAGELRMARMEASINELVIQQRLMSEQVKQIPEIQDGLACAVSFDEKAKRQNLTFTEIMKATLPAIIAGGVVILGSYVHIPSGPPSSSPPPTANPSKSP
jgi:hypothetical protein